MQKSARQRGLLVFVALFLAWMPQVRAQGQPNIVLIYMDDLGYGDVSSYGATAFHLPRPFRMPWVPALPVLSAAVSLVLMLGLPRATWERLVIWMIMGVVLYFAYGHRHSRLRTGDMR